MPIGVPLGVPLGVPQLPPLHEAPQATENITPNSVRPKIVAA